MTSTEPSLHPQTRRHLANTERLQRAAIQEFSREGFAGAKISNIVASAALSQPSFYRVWPSKEAAYTSIIQDTNLLWQSAAFDSLLLEGEHPDALHLEHKITHFFHVLTSNPELTQLVLRHNAATDQHTLYVGIYRERFAALIEKALIETVLAPELLAQVYCALTERFLYARLIEQAKTPGQAARELISVLSPLLYRT